jgi:hypothetical protein
MFNPSRDDVRRFFTETWRKHRAGELLTPLEDKALRRILLHPEYHALLDDPDAVAADFSIARGEPNPFLHLSMHLALDEQLAIDQPIGIRAVYERIAARHGGEHEAAHEAMECLGRVLWEAQRGVLPADPAAINDALLECLKRRAAP